MLKLQRSVTLLATDKNEIGLQLAMSDLSPEL